MKRFIIVISSIFAIAFALVVGFRMSPDAMAVIIGIICGMLASVPTSIILVWVLRQRDRQMDAQIGPSRMGHYPPVVVVNGQGTNGYGTAPPPPALTAAATSNGSRDFKIVGQENTESAGDILPPFWENV
jgi:hypothetical protein